MVAAQVFAVIVTFYPERSRLEQLLARLGPQLSHIILVDNASVPALLADQLSLPMVTLLAQAHNLGVAAALNRGASFALAHGATHLLLLDQDSLPAPDMVARLLEGEEWLRRHRPGCRLAALGPTCRDRETGHILPFVPVRLPRSANQPDQPSPFIEVCHLISSGTLIPVAAWQEIGPLCEPLFIDYVDVEWGWRARAWGWLSLGVVAAKLEHQLGHQRRRLPGGRLIALHHPFRYYYIVRNALYLFTLAYIPRRWKVAEAARLGRRLLGYGLLVRPHREYLAAVFDGLRDFWRGRMGRRPSRSG